MSSLSWLLLTSSISFSTCVRDNSKVTPSSTNFCISKDSSFACNIVSKSDKTFFIFVISSSIDTLCSSKVLISAVCNIIFFSSLSFSSSVVFRSSNCLMPSTNLKCFTSYLDINSLCVVSISVNWRWWLSRTFFASLYFSWSSKCCVLFSLISPSNDLDCV